MNYHVIVQRLAKQDLQAAYRWAANHAPLTASRWLDRFQEALQSLEQFPERCTLAREHGKVDAEVREFLFGKRPYVFRVVFAVDGDAVDGDAVRVLRICRAQRRSLTRSELKQALDLDKGQ